MIQRQLLAKRIGLVALTNLLVELNSLIMLPLLTKNLPVSEYGVWVQISVTIGLVPAVALMGLPYSMVRFLPSAKGRENIREIFFSMAGVIALAGLVASAGIYLLADPIASALFDGRRIIVRYLSVLILLECLINIPFSYFRGVQQIKKYSIFNFSKVLFGLILAIHFVLSGNGIIGALTALLLSDALILLAMCGMVIMDIGLPFPTLNNIREYLAFGMPTIPGNLSSWIVNSSNRYVVGILMGTTFVGYFSPGYTLGNMINLFIVPLSFILPAALSKHYDEHEVDEVKVILEFSLKYFLALAIPAAFGLSLLSRPILSILSTQEIASHGYLITPLMALGALLLGAYAIVAQILVLEKNTVLTGKIWIMAAILNLASSVLLVSWIGIIGGAVATLISFLFAFVSAFYYSNKLIALSLDCVFLGKSLAASLAMSFMLVLLDPQASAGILFSIAIGAVTYFLVLFALKGFTRDEIDFVKSIL
jgi:O-antigen/teichoic acid export membrane protein